MVLFLRDRTPFFHERLRVLHFAPELDLLERFRRIPTLEYVPADLDPPAGAQRADITNIDLDAPFDAVIASHVLEHVPRDRKAMSELFRVLRPGGWALLMVPLFSETYEDPTVITPRQRYRVFGQPDHVRLYGPDFAERLEEAGFEVTAERYATALGPEAASRHRLHDYDVIHFCVKPER